MEVEAPASAEDVDPSEDQNESYVRDVFEKRRFSVGLLCVDDIVEALLR